MKITKNMKIAVATGITLFSLLVSFTATFSWFTLKNNSEDNDGMNIKADNYSTSFISVQVHKCIPDRCTSETLVFNSKAAFSISEGSSPSDSLVIDDFGELNLTQPVLLLFNLKQNTPAYRVRITATVNSSTSWMPTITSENVNNYPLSNAVYFRSGGFNRTSSGSSSNSSSSSASTSEEPFLFEEIATSEIPQLKSFVNFAEVEDDPETTNIVESGFEYESFSRSITVFQGSGDGTLTHVGVVMDYYHLALDMIREEASGKQVVINNKNRIGFVCDWKMVVQ